MKKIRAEFLPFSDDVPQESTYKDFEFDDKVLEGHNPDIFIKGKLWVYANKNNLALYNYESIR